MKLQQKSSYAGSKCSQALVTPSVTYKQQGLGSGFLTQAHNEFHHDTMQDCASASMLCSVCCVLCVLRIHVAHAWPHKKGQHSRSHQTHKTDNTSFWPSKGDKTICVTCVMQKLNISCPDYRLPSDSKAVTSSI